MRAARRILQMMLATGWSVVYRDDGGDLIVPLACWVLVEEDGEQYVAGIDMTGEPPDGSQLCDDVANFKEYRWTGVDISSSP